MSTHVCTASTTCQCSITALEPNEQCPIHGDGEYPARCDCGRFIRAAERAIMRQQEEYAGVDVVAAEALFAEVRDKCVMPKWGPWHPFRVLEENGYVLPLLEGK